MRKLLVASALGIVSVWYSGLALAGPTAVIQVNEDPYYTAHRDYSFGGARLTRFYAPLPVFFEGWPSTPRASIVDYAWNFGDGSPIFHGFNAAHVYETPGNYTCTLTVTDNTNATDSATMPVTVLARTGKPVYYVDSQLGNDSNPGTSPGAGAWKTADRAFQGLTDNEYTPGTQILFKRGETFSVTAGLVEVSHWRTGSGWLFGAYGTGAKPIIKLTGVTGNFDTVFYIYGVGIAHCTFEDLSFDLTSDTGQVASFFTDLCEAFDLLFLRVDVKNMYNGITMSGGSVTRRQSGIFIVDCTMSNSTLVENYASACRYALIGNDFEHAGNHINYLAFIDKGVIADNTFYAPAFGRTALRISGESGTGDTSTPTNNVEVCDNNFVGWIDPINGYPTAGWNVKGSPNYDPAEAHNGGGTQYNWQLIFFSPNNDTPQLMTNVVFERNTVVNAECFMVWGDYTGLTVRNNTFATVDPSGEYRFNVESRFVLKPLEDLYFTNNVVVSNEDRDNGYHPGLFKINSFTIPTSYTDLTGKTYPYTYVGPSTHQNLNIKNNTFVMNGLMPGDTYLYFIKDDAPLRAQVLTDNNTIYSTSDQYMAQITGDNLLNRGTVYSLSAWQAFSGHDAGTKVIPFTKTPVAGTVTVAANTSSTPIVVNYSGVQDLSGTGLKGVYLWVKKGNYTWEKTTLSSTATSGTFNYTDVPHNDTYYFALQVEDNAGDISAPPAGFGQASTVYYVPDTTPPTVGTLSAPANSSGDITVTYSGVADEPYGSGLQEVRLWVKQGSGGTWQATSHAQSFGAGSFRYSEMTANDTYYFAIQAVDNAGNYSPTPTGNGMASTVYTAATDMPLYSKFDASPSGGVLDSSVFGNNGVCPNTLPTLVTGKIGSAYQFDGVGNFVTFNNVAPYIAATQRVSITAWVNAPAGYDTTKQGAILSVNSIAGTTYGNVVALYAGSATTAGDANTLVLGDGGTGLDEGSGGAVIADGTWHHIALTSDGNIAKLYVDGVLRTSYAVDYTFSPTDTWSVGQRYSGSTAGPTRNQLFQGSVDDLKVWDYVLSDSDIAAVYNGAGPGGGSAPTSDLMPPTPGILVAPVTAKASPIKVTYSDASDTGGSGLKEVHLWVQPLGGAWADTGLVSTSASGSFNYTGMTGNGLYAFALQAFDNAGNSSPAPSWFGQGVTIYDTVPPFVPWVTAPETANGTSVKVSYADASDSGSGLAKIDLWVKKDTGTWADSGLIQTSASGSFTYPCSLGDGTYYFDTVVTDVAGNTSAAITGNGQAATLFSGTQPTAATVTAPANAKASPITLTYAGATTGTVGLKSVDLWVKDGTGGTWTDTGLSQTTASGSFNYAGMTGDGTYFFSTVTQDNANYQSPAPTGSGSASTVYDTTPPTVPTLSVAASTTASPISISYAGAADSGSGLQNVSLWVRKDTGAWADTGLSGTAASGTFGYTGMTGNGTYYFATVATDNAGNSSAPVSGAGQASTSYGNSTLSAALVTAPAMANSSPIALTYSGATTGSSGLKSVSLWAKQGAGGVWADTGLSQTTASGSFSYTGMAGDATYFFATVVTDNLNNQSPAPTGSGSGSTVYDTTAPTPAAISAPTSTNTSPITVTYSGAADNGSGLKLVDLWVRKDTGAWADTGLSAATASGAFSFAALSGDGTYYFATVATDNAGNVSAVPSGNGQGSTIYSTAAPTAATVTGVSPDKASPIALAYSGATTGPSGLKSVDLWVKKGAGGAWADTGTSQTTASGTFNFAGMSGDDTYFFATRVLDNAGNLSPAPSGSGTGSVVYDTTAPTAPTLGVPASAGSSPITVTYSGASDTGSGLKQVNLWVKKDTGSWADSGMAPQSAASGSFAYSGMSGNGTYYFASVATDNAGNVSAAPSGNGQGSTTYNTTAPTAPTITAPPTATASPISLTYSGASGDASGLKLVDLWAKKGAGGTWGDTGLSQTTASGSFSYTGATGDDTYFFAARVQDNAGTWSATPSGSGSASTVLDTTAPTAATITAPTAVKSSPIGLTYSGAADSGSGVKQVELWFKKDSGAWTDSGLSQTGTSGSYSFTGTSGDGVYAFATVVTDNAGNQSAAPSGAGAASTMLDTTPPTQPGLNLATASWSAPITVGYSGASDSGSGLKQVNLWVRKDAGLWADSGLPAQTTASGSFSYPASAGDGTYYFEAVATDNAGNTSAAPTGSGTASTVLNTATATAPTLSVPATTKASPITVSYSGASAGSGVKQVSLWVRKDAGSWGNSGLSQTTTSGSFSYTGMSGDGTYYFAAVVLDNQNNSSPAPSGNGAAATVYDTTAPTVGTASSKKSTKNTPISVSYSGVTDAGSGVKQVNLWVKKDTGTWADSGLVLTTQSGKFEYPVSSGNGTYYFGLVAQDNAGNSSVAPTGSGLTSTIYDTVLPNNGTANSAKPKAANGSIYFTSSPITVTYSGASDSLSGLALVHLWVKTASGVWTNTGLTQTTGSGSFSYTGMAGDGVYSFAVCAEDNAGNLVSAPQGAGDVSVVYDTTAPTAGAATSPPYSNSSPIAITYTGATDSGSGLKQVTLWAQKDGGGWAATALTATTGSGSFSFVPTGDGTYSFAVQATDNAGLTSVTPSGSGDTSTVYDTTSPTPGTLTAPAKEDGPPISITYSGAGDGTGSGLKNVYLWVKKGSGGTWANAGLSSTGASGSFYFSGMTGDDTYYFGLQAQDNAGNVSAAPSGSGGGSTVYNTTFSPGTASSPAYATAGPIQVTYSGAQDTANGGIKAVHLWMKKGTDGTWSDTGLSSPTTSGSFSFNGFSGDATYYFATQAEANNGAFTLPVSGNGDTATIFDTTAPTPGTITPEKYANATPIKIDFAGASDAGSGLKLLTLWVKKGFSGAWTKTTLTSTAASGSFNFTGVSGNDQYFFYLQAEDNAGNKTPDPTDLLVFGTSTPGP